MPTPTPPYLQVSGMLGGTFLANSPVVVQFHDMVWPTGSSVHMLVADVTVQWSEAEPDLRAAFIAQLSSLAGQNPDRRWAGYIAALSAEVLPQQRSYNYSFLVADMTEYSLDIRTAYQSYYFDYDFHREAIMANAVITFLPSSVITFKRAPIKGKFEVAMTYIDSIGIKQSKPFDGWDNSYAFQGRFTEMERLLRAERGAASIAADIDPVTGYAPATTKPNLPELIGADSLFVISRFIADIDSSDSDVAADIPVIETAMLSKNCAQTTYFGHTIVRDSSRRYTDFLFVNARGAIESCSGVALENMEITATTKHYHHEQGASFSPERPLFSVADGGQRSWDMSSGYVSRAWAEWWVLEFLRSPQWWMRIGDRYYPVLVEPSKKSLGIYDRTKQDMPHVNFTVTLAYEG